MKQSPNVRGSGSSSGGCSDGGSSGGGGGGGGDESLIVDEKLGRTKWCGTGNVANSYNDLGIWVKEDRCCREHDHCPIQLEPGQCRNGICNFSPFTRSHCDCDNAFRRCLEKTKSNIANIIGSIYFNVAQGTCISERRFCPQAMRCSVGEFRRNRPYKPSSSFSFSSGSGSSGLVRIYNLKKKLFSNLFSGIFGGNRHLIIL
ncbi:Phospholipase A2, putative [Pediculus humanus corporis]|uniref:phospholipase A2 n=1 Tax=Pediculus humanus subsp. corporis TaxID=121224 RepID=E0VU92_PEDHC|nr:Phospholipase A2, putative [Pediculus humanus corporis]EEB16948.1 Phospholipase A2, putative [Pediculus humanus corporis]